MAASPPSDITKLVEHGAVDDVSSTHELRFVPYSQARATGRRRGIKDDSVGDSSIADVDTSDHCVG